MVVGWAGAILALVLELRVTEEVTGLEFEIAVVLLFTPTELSLTKNI